MKPNRSILLHPDFRRLWASDAVSQVGTAVTLVALPLVAVTTLHATPLEAGLLVMFEYLAFLIIGLPAGAWVDRLRQRRVMVVCDLARAALFGSIPLAACLGTLSLGQLYVVAFGASVCASFADVAAQSQLPRLVDGGELLAANVTLEATRNVAQAGGPAAGGALIGAVTAPIAIAVDAASFALSALLLSRVRRPEADPRPRGGATLRSEIAAGLRFVLGHRLLRAITVSAAVSNLCGTIGAAMLPVLLAGQLGLSPFLCGVVFSAEAVGGLLGALAVRRIVARLGQGPAICVSMAVSAVLWALALPMYQADRRLAAAIVLQSLGWVAFMTFKITTVSFRQRLCPTPMLGRMTATVRFVVWGSMPIGALIGGLLGQHLGVRPAMGVGVLGELLAVLPVLLSPLRTMRELPHPVEPEAATPVPA